MVTNCDLPGAGLEFSLVYCFSKLPKLVGLTLQRIPSSGDMPGTLVFMISLAGIIY